MKAVIIRETGGPDKLLYEEVDTPSPGPGEVLVRLRAAGVTSVKAGDRVSISIIASCGTCRLCRTGRENLCEAPNGALDLFMWGTYAEYTCVKENQLVAMPDALDFETAAAGHLCFATAWHMAVTLGNIHAGQDVLVNAAGAASAPPPSRSPSCTAPILSLPPARTKSWPAPRSWARPV